MVTAQMSTLIGLRLASLLQHEMLADVCFGSKADIGVKKGCPLYPEKRTSEQTSRCPLCANSGHRERYSITLVAVSSNLSGIAMPSALAALWLITSSKLVGC